MGGSIISALIQFSEGTLANPAEVNQNFETLRQAVNANITENTNINSEISNINLNIETISEQVMPDLNFTKTDSLFITSGDKNSITLKAGTVIRLDVAEDDVRYLEVKEDTDYNIYNIMDTGAGSLTAGQDYYLYVVKKDIANEETSEIVKTVELKASSNSTYPNGYTASNSRKIGGFHTNCLAITSANAPQTGHALIGYNAGDIVPETVWCLSHRPIATPEGMSYDDRLDLWVDCYNTGGSDGDLTSSFGATRTCNITYQALAERLGKAKKRFPTVDEFQILADGANQKTAVYGSAQPNPDTTGGHLDTAGKAMVTPKGVWETNGLQWQFARGVSGDGGSGFTTTDGSGAKGQTYGTARIVFAGGGWDDSSSCGSRALSAADALSLAAAYLGGRAVSQPLRV